MSGNRRGSDNHMWRGGRSVASNGYVLIRVGADHPLADVRGYAYEHRLIAFAKLGRLLRDDEVVHHRDGNKQNNAWDNLEILTHHQHRVEHRGEERGLRMPGEPNPLIECACGCGTQLYRFDEAGRPRSHVSGHNAQPSPTRDAILALLRAHGGRAKRAAVFEGLPEIGKQALAVALSKMKVAGIISYPSRGEYELVEVSPIKRSA